MALLFFRGYLAGDLEGRVAGDPAEAADPAARAILRNQGEGRAVLERRCRRAQISADDLAAAAIRVVLPVVAERVREWAVVTAAMLATAVLFAVYPLLHSPLAMGLCSVLLGFALGSVQPMIMSTLHQITPEARHGEALGLRLMAINGSSVVMPMLFGVAGAVIGISGVFWAVGAAVGAGAHTASRLRAGKTP